MDKLSSIIAALEAGKLPTTRQVVQFIDCVEMVALPRAQHSMEAMTVDIPDMSAQGKIIANHLKNVLECYKQLAIHKNSKCEDYLQDALWHLSQGDVGPTSKTTEDAERVKRDMAAIRDALRTLISIIWTSIATEGTSLFYDFASFTRLALADAAEAIEGVAGVTKEKLKEHERGFQAGERDVLGRDKKRLEEEQDVKVAWEHGMEKVKQTGSGVIETSRTVASSTQETAEKTKSRLGAAYDQICDRAQSDPAFKEAVDAIFNIVQLRLNQTLDTAADPHVTLQSFIHDETPEKHIDTAIMELRMLLERLSNQSLDPFMHDLRKCIVTITSDQHLRQWFNDFFDLARHNLKDAQYARSDESRQAREELRVRWEDLLKQDVKWKAEIDKLKEELVGIQTGINADKDLNNLRDALDKLNLDLQQGLIGIRAEAEVGVQETLDQVTWFWQDLFRYYVPQILQAMKDVPIPRTEYKDQEIEFVLENLDISSFNLHPSHVYLRNITDVDISTTSAAATKTAVGALTHIRIQALQMALDDVSFWYRDKTFGLGPKEFTGLMGVTLPEKGVDVDMKLMLIPAHVKGPRSRESLKHFNTIEKIEVHIAEDVEIEVKESDHPIMLTLFKPLILARLKRALERSLAEQLRSVLDWFDGTAFDVSKRMEVFEDAGLAKGSALMAAIWSETGKLQRHGVLGRGEVVVHATGTGMVVERYEYTEGGEKEKAASFAMGAEPQILSGEKRGPLGVGSESLRAETMPAAEGVSVEEARRKAEGLVRTGRRQVQSFKRSVEVKAGEEKRRPGWQSDAFNVA
ncbi:hypothetical protein APHAL10511_008143 [Amanita phalloides]|nr:hypothetical protein APHAL10511_008143 [Amanita phalloides]